MKNTGAIIIFVLVLTIAAYVHYRYERDDSGPLPGPSSSDVLPEAIPTKVDGDPRFGDVETDPPTSSSLLVTAHNAQHIELRPLGDLAELRARASKGDSAAAYDLYRFFESCLRNSTLDKCRRDEVDATEASTWLTMAADAEYLPAQTEYYNGILMTSGESAINQREKIIWHLNSAADKGAVDAMFWLVTLSTNNLDFTMTYDGADDNYVLNRTDAYAYLLVAAATYEALGIRSSVSRYVEKAGLHFSPSEFEEARRRAQAILDKDECCKVWRN